MDVDLLVMAASEVLFPVAVPEVFAPVDEEVQALHSPYVVQIVDDFQPAQVVDYVVDELADLLVVVAVPPDEDVALVEPAEAVHFAVVVPGFFVPVVVSALVLVVLVELAQLGLAVVAEEPVAGLPVVALATPEVAVWAAAVVG